MKSTFLRIAVAAFLACTAIACSESSFDNSKPDKSAPITIIATIDGDDSASATADTRIAMDDNGVSTIKLTWKVGDAIYVVSATDNTAYKFTATMLSNNDKSAVFESPEGYPEGMVPAYAIWVGTETITTFDPKNISTNALKVYASTTELAKNYRLYAKYDTEAGTFAFKPLLSILRFELTLPAEETAIKAFRIQMQDELPAFNQYSYDITGENVVATPTSSVYNFYSPSLNIALTNNRAVLYLLVGENLESQGRKMDITVNKQLRAKSQTCGNMNVGKVAPIRKTTWTPIFSGGQGTQADPYKIASEDNLRALALEANGGEAYANTYFRMEDNIQITTSPKWKAIGSNQTTLNTSFKGTFNGNNKTISFTTLELEDLRYAGIFGVINGTVSDLTVAGNITYEGVHCVNLGGVAGRVLTTLTNCHHIGDVIGHSTSTNEIYAGGVAGNSTSLEGCTQKNGTIQIDNSKQDNGAAGGVVGYTSALSMHSCKVESTVIKANKGSVGALVGKGSGNPVIPVCNTWTSDVTAETNGVQVTPTPAFGTGGSVSDTPCELHP